MDRECRRVTAGRGLQKKDEFAYLGTILDVRFEYTSPLLEFIECTSGCIGDPRQQFWTEFV